MNHQQFNPEFEGEEEAKEQHNSYNPQSELPPIAYNSRLNEQNLDFLVGLDDGSAVMN